ncbi:2'-5' RNA ligase superfamily-domain-containing protein [Massariosphaeria phaeospora]|uniref:2'-5' RNA ligase superfamily-domain-containing protein n=1 Tax=Massariosphaeria phaeospora TaxID=100035 RepID=A0A7C8I5M4_9PLEO|nr:2'-5' RNA ligase superfamily-domain-containing protein [Massariosphaeria phaeospora]
MAPRRLPLHLSYRCALALLPPAAITPPLEAVRRERDNYFAHWPPHINLLYPFLKSPSNWEPSEPQGDVRATPPFHVSLICDQPSVVSHHASRKTVWLEPTSRSIHQLQAALQAEFSECNADNWRYRPHLSVGEASSDDGAKKLSSEITKSVSDFLACSAERPLMLDWYVDKVYVMEREGYYDRFEIVGAIDLGQK